MKECKSGHCDIGASHESEASYGNPCSCGGDQSCSCGCSCGCGGGCSCCGKADELLIIAKSAHQELLKQKMKAAFEAKIGKKMDKVANLVVSKALACMQDRMASKQTREDFDSELMKIFKS
jgi:hypothetical protein